MEIQLSRYRSRSLALSIVGAWSLLTAVARAESAVPAEANGESSEAISTAAPYAGGILVGGSLGGGRLQASKGIAGVGLEFHLGYFPLRRFGVLASGSVFGGQETKERSLALLGGAVLAEFHLLPRLWLAAGPGYYVLSASTKEEGDEEAKEVASSRAIGGELNLGFDVYRVEKPSGFSAGVVLRSQAAPLDGRAVFSMLALVGLRWYGGGGAVPVAAPPSIQASASPPAPGHEPGDVLITADNYYVAYVGSATGENLRPISQIQGSWERVKHERLGKVEPSDYLYVLAWDTGGPQAFIADVTLPDGSTLSTNQTDFRSTLADIPQPSTLPDVAAIKALIEQADWRAPGASTPAGTSPWGLAGAFGTSAQYIWHDSFQSSVTDGKAVLFRSTRPLKPLAGTVAKKSAVTSSEGGGLEVVSTCGDEVGVVRYERALGGKPCAYRMGPLDSLSQELSFTARSLAGQYYDVWVGRLTGVDHALRGFSVHYGNGKIHLRHHDGPRVTPMTSEVSVPNPGASQRWRIARSGRRVLIWLNDRLVATEEGLAEAGEAGVLLTHALERIELSALGRTALPGQRASEYAALTPIVWPQLAVSTAPAPAKPAKPARMIGSCDIDAIDWKNREYAPSKHSKNPYTLVDGIHRLTVKQGKDFFSDKMIDQGTQLAFNGVVPAELDGQSPQEVVVTITPGDFGYFHGNSVPPPDPETKYVFRLKDGCEPELLGGAEVGADDIYRFEDNALVVFKNARNGGSKFKREVWRLKEDKFQRTSTDTVDRDALDEPLPECDEAKSLASLPSFAGLEADKIHRDPCVVRKLRARLGKKRDEFWSAMSGPISRIESRDGHLVVSGCQAHRCFRQGAFTINLQTGAVEAVIYELNSNMKRVGKQWITTVKVQAVQWLTATSRPTPVLSAVIEQNRQQFE